MGKERKWQTKKRKVASAESLCHLTVNQKHSYYFKINSQGLFRMRTELPQALEPEPDVYKYLVDFNFCLGIFNNISPQKENKHIKE